MIVDDAQSIFVRNLPFSASTTDLEVLCGKIGPVKRASIIQSGDGVSRGFGFVKYAMPEDAMRAVAILSGAELNGRTLSIELALKRGQKPSYLSQASKAEGIEGKKSHESHSSTSLSTCVKTKKGDGTGPELKRSYDTANSKDSMNRNNNKRGKHLDASGASKKKKSGHALLSSQPSKTLILFNMASRTTEKQIFKRVRKLEPPTSVKIEDIDGSARVAIIHFNTSLAAKKVQKKLNNHVIHGQIIKVRPFHPKVNIDASLEAKFSINDTLKRSLTNSDLDEMKGQAKRNNRLIIRNLSFKATEDDLKVALSKFGPILEAKIPHVAVRGIEGRRGFGFVTFACAEDAEKAVKNEIPLRIRGREVAVDVCMGRKEYEEERKNHKEDDLNKGKAENSGEIEHNTTSFGEESVSVPGNVPSSDITVKDTDTFSEAHEREETPTGVTTEKTCPKNPPSSDVNEGKTIFVRNIPFDATSESLKLAFHDYAPVAFAIVVKDCTTGMSKGTAFIKFKSKVGMETTLSAAACGGGTLPLLGRDVKIDRALETKDAPKAVVSDPVAADLSSGHKSKVDRRNLYLANEGLLIGSEAQNEIPKGDIEKRQREQAEKKAKLRNPYFFVSPTRLSIRNLRRSVGDEEVRNLLVQAVQKGINAKQVTPDDLILHLKAQGLYEQALRHEDLSVFQPRSRDIHIKVKIMRDLSKTPMNGVFPSRGYAFADFTSHIHALAALRHLNNNPTFSGFSITSGAAKSSRLIVSFAVENHKALQKKALRGEKIRTALAPEATSIARMVGGKHDAHSNKCALGKSDDPHNRGAQQAPLEEPCSETADRKRRGSRQREQKRRRKDDGEEKNLLSVKRRVESPSISQGNYLKALAAGKRKLASDESGGELSIQRLRQRNSKAFVCRPVVKEQTSDFSYGESTFQAANPKIKRQAVSRTDMREDKQFFETVNDYKKKLLGGTTQVEQSFQNETTGKSERWFEM